MTLTKFVRIFLWVVGLINFGLGFVSPIGWSSVLCWTSSFLCLVVSLI